MYIIKKMPIFSTPWTSWKVKWFLKVWSACSKVLHSLSPQLFTLPALPPFSVNLHLLKVCHPSEVSFPAYIISLLNCSSPQLTCAISPALSLVLSTFSPVLCGLWPLLHRAATTAPALFCKLHVASMGVLVCSPKPPLVPLRQLAWLLYFWRVLPFPAPLHIFEADQLPFPPPPLPHQPVTWQLLSCRLAQPCCSLSPRLFHPELCTSLFYRSFFSEVTTNFPSCLLLISDIFVNKFWCCHFL